MFQLLASSGANKLLPRFQSVLPFFFSFLSSVSSLPYIQFLIEKNKSLTCGDGICNDHFVTNFVLSLAVKKFGKSSNISRSTSKVSCYF